MAKVDFYIVSDESDGAVLRVGCRIVEKAWHLGHRVYVLTDSAERSGEMDDLLWTFRHDSFVPHARYPSGEAHDTLGTPVLIGELDTLPEDVAVLVNLSGRLPACAGECDRIAEVVAASEGARADARERYRTYRDQGAELDSHEV